jgi:preprotein translocase subunit SecD
MKSLAGRINIILALLFCACSGCQSASEKKDAGKDDKKKAAMLRFYIETNPDPTGHTMDVPIYRATPMTLTVEREPVLDEAFMKNVEVVDADEMGGVALKVTFDEFGTRRLDALTIEHRGQHVAIEAAWTEHRWLAAPLLNKRISNGIFVFTPDATREEAERIAKGVNNVIKKLHES